MRVLNRGGRNSIRLQALPLLLVLAQAVAAQAPPRAGSEADWTETIRKTMPGVVSIVLYNAEGKPESGGSGFLVMSDGVVVTNYHVIQGGSAAKVFTKQGEEFEVKGVVAFDRAKDFAILKIPGFDLPVVPLGNSNNTEIGEGVLAIGDPRGLTGSVSSGILSAKGREERGSTWIQTTTPVSPGNSGGPLLNRRGEVIGVISWGRTDGQNLNFAVPINYVRGALQLGTAIKYSLPQLVKAEAEMARVVAEKKQEEFLNLFTPYEDPNGIFKLVVPKEWRVQQRRNNLDGGVTSIETIIAPRSAALAELGGYLSDGIRIVVLLPAAGGAFTGEAVETWKTQFPETVLKGNPGFELTNTGMFLINDLQAKVYTFEGKGQKLAEPEKTVNYVFGSGKAIVNIEVVQPISRLQSLEFFSKLAKSFQFEPNFRGGAVGLTSGPAGRPASTVTLGEIESSFRSNLFDDTIRAASRFLETTPNSKEAHTYLGLSLLIKKEVDKGVFHLQRAVLLGQPVTLPVKRLREPLLGHGLDDAAVTLTPDSVIITTGGNTYQARFSSLSESGIRSYGTQCPVMFLKGSFTEPAKNKQGEKGFNLFPPSATLRPVQQGTLVYNVAACTDEGIVTTGIAKLINGLAAAGR
ncbi:MAG TPA: trypsin-like peptidase domain-containing protein [Pyrinomonadaceae bacterium]